VGDVYQGKDVSDVTIALDRSRLVLFVTNSTWNSDYDLS
jgi:hypothetical protein